MWVDVGAWVNVRMCLFVGVCVWVDVCGGGYMGVDVCVCRWMSVG